MDMLTRSDIEGVINRHIKHITNVFSISVELFRQDGEMYHFFVGRYGGRTWRETVIKDPVAMFSFAEGAQEHVNAIETEEVQREPVMMSFAVPDYENYNDTWQYNAAIIVRDWEQLEEKREVARLLELLTDAEKQMAQRLADEYSITIRGDLWRGFADITRAYIDLYNDLPSPLSIPQHEELKLCTALRIKGLCDVQSFMSDVVFYANDKTRLAAQLIADAQADAPAEGE